MEEQLNEVKVDEEKLEAVSEFCYLGDMLYAGGGCELATVTHCKCALGKFSPTAPPSHQPQSAPCEQRKGVFNMRKECDAAEAWVMAAATVNHLPCNERCNDPLDL